MEKKQITIVTAVIKNENGEFLLAKRYQPDIPAEHDKWEFVGGGINFGETPEQALKREAREEADIDIQIIRLLPKILTHVWEGQKPERQIIILNFECRIIGGKPKANDPEISDLRFIDPKDLPKYDTLPNVMETVAMLNG